MEMKEVLDREGRDAKNLLVYQFCENLPTEGKTNEATSIISRKPPAIPPRSPSLLSRKAQFSERSTSKQNGCPRVRSASTGRDKKSELQARYWALLFGNLQRAVNEIYQTVECYENISSCQEAILVLENYVRDFKALSEWFKVSWDYESRPLQQRPQSLAWEVRKSNPLPRVRAKSLSSPGSGKSSPCQCRCSLPSGKVSPCCGLEALSPRKSYRACDTLPKSAMRVNVRELFSSSKRQTNEQPAEGQEPRAVMDPDPIRVLEVEVESEIGNEKEDNESPKMRHQYAQTDLEDDHLTLADIQERMRLEAKDYMEECLKSPSNRIEQNFMSETMYNIEFMNPSDNCNDCYQENNIGDCCNVVPNINTLTFQEITAVEMTLEKLNAMENEFLAKNIIKDPKIMAPDQQEIQTNVLMTIVASAQSTLDSQTTLLEQNGPLMEILAPQPELKSNPTVRNGPMEVILAERSNERPHSIQLKETEDPNESIQTNPMETAKSDAAGQILGTAKKPSISNTNASNAPLKYSSVVNRPATVRCNFKNMNARPTVNTNNKSNVVTKTNANTSVKRSITTNPMSKLHSVCNGSPNSYSNEPKAPLPRTSKRKEPYGPPSHVASRLSARSKTMVEMKSAPKTPVTNRNMQSRTATLPLSRKSSREDVCSSSSTLKASCEKIPLTRESITQLTPMEQRRSEPKQLPSDANDGWLMVKNRRRSSMHWANRFYQPTGYASLPTLALLDDKNIAEDKQKKIAPTSKFPQTQNQAPPQSKPTSKPQRQQKTQKSEEKPARVSLRPEIKNAKAKVNSFPCQRPANAKAKSDQSQSQPQPQSQASPSSTRCPSVPTRQTIIQRQKSDITGLKMTSLHKEFMRSEKNAHRKNIALKHSAPNCSISANEEETISVHDHNDSDSNMENSDQNKIDIKIQTNCDFSKTIGELYESVSSAFKIPIGYSNGSGGVLSSCDETDENLSNDMDCDEDEQRMLVEEQESLERQIRELESTEIDVDTETDETDCEVIIEREGLNDDDAIDLTLDDVFITVNESESDLNVSLEKRYHALLSEMSWGEREEALATLQAYVSRHPGRAQELHQKLSSPSRRRSLQETLKKYQAKQARAQQKRELLQKEKAIKIQQLLARVEDVKAAKQQLIENKRMKMEDRLQRAAENREQYLRQIIEKAHDEEKKLKEINFIKNIEAQNKRLDLIESSRETEGRLQDLEQERQKRVEEKAAKEAAVERRKQELEKERQRKLEKLNETRLEKEQRIGKMQEQKEKQRQALAREKARDREERLLALQAQHQESTEKLQRKIIEKQKESARRHEENIEHIRQRALELTIPSRNVDENGSNRCENGDGDDGEHSSTVSDVSSREHSRGYKKKLKKLRQRMAQCAEEYISSLAPMPLHLKRDSQVPKLLNLIAKGGGNQGLERTLSQLQRIVAKAKMEDFQCLLLMDGLGLITQHVITKHLEENSDISKKSMVIAVQLYRNACTLCPQLSRHAILGNSICGLFDAVFQSIQLPEQKTPQYPVELCTEIMLACTVALSPSYAKKHTNPRVLERLPDVVGYAVMVGLIEILSRRCMKVRESIENQQGMVLSLLATLGFLSKFADICPPGPSDPTRFLSAIRSTELFGTISMLYASVVPIGESIPPRTISLAAATFNLLISVAVLDLATFQDVLTSESICLKYLDVITILLNYCGNEACAAKNSETQAVMVDLIASIGFFCANNKKHQDLLVSEQCSIIIKSLSKLPANMNAVTYPCVVTMTYQNAKARDILSHEFDLSLIDEYSKSEMGRKNHLVAILCAKED